MVNKRLAMMLLLVLVLPSAFGDGGKPVCIAGVPVAERPCLAIVSFDDGSIPREKWWGPSWDVGSGLADILTTSMLDSNRFRLLERGLLAKVTAEQDLSASARVDASKAARIGKVIGGDYLVMGRVTEFACETRRASGVGEIAGSLVGLKQSVTKAHVAVDIHIVDADTSEILGSFTGRGEESRTKFGMSASGVGAFAIGSYDFMQSILGVATRKAIDQFTANLCKALDQKKLVLPPKHTSPVRPDGVVLNVEGKMLVANIGAAKGYAIGDCVELRRNGKVLRDPDTGEVLRVTSELVCSGKIIRIDEKTATFSSSQAAVSRRSRAIL